MNSKRMAIVWPYPRHDNFKKILKTAAGNWFSVKGVPTHPKMPYCLDSWQNWRRNIILDSVADYVESEQRTHEQRSEPYPLHKYIHHGLSSQAMLFNLLGPLVVESAEYILVDLMRSRRLSVPKGNFAGKFEFSDRKVFNEDSGQPTSLDFVLNDESGVPRIFIEGKLSEHEFGSCSVFVAGDCDGSNPCQDKSSCYLHHIKRTYLDMLEEFGFTELMKNEKFCPLINHYQFFREVLMSLKYDGVFVLLFDDRSPVFYCKGTNGTNRGLMPLLMQFVPIEYQNRIAAISVQEIVGAIRASGRHRHWIEDFAVKYGLPSVV